MGEKPLAPCFQRFSIVEAQDLEVRDEQPRTLDDGQHFRQCRNVATGENIFCDPGIGDTRTFGTADRMEQHNAVFTKQPCAFLKKSVVMPDSNMLEHADRNNAVKHPAHVTIILQQKPGALAQASLRRAFVGSGILFPGQCHAGNVATAKISKIQAKSAPAASNVEDSLSV